MGVIKGWKPDTPHSDWSSITCANKKWGRWDDFCNAGGSRNNIGCPSGEIDQSITSISVEANDGTTPIVHQRSLKVREQTTGAGDAKCHAAEFAEEAMAGVDANGAFV
ncbi:hypothetical protein ACA910_003569 [Epithemia clementina (nom. ined.)]